MARGRGTGCGGRGRGTGRDDAPRQRRRGRGAIPRLAGGKQVLEQVLAGDERPQLLQAALALHKRAPAEQRVEDCHCHQRQRQPVRLIERQPEAHRQQPAEAGRQDQGVVPVARQPATGQRLAGEHLVGDDRPARAARRASPAAAHRADRRSARGSNWQRHGRYADTHHQAVPERHQRGYGEPGTGAPGGQLTHEAVAVRADGRAFRSAWSTHRPLNVR